MTPMKFENFFNAVTRTSQNYTENLANRKNVQAFRSINWNNKSLRRLCLNKTSSIVKTKQKNV